MAFTPHQVHERFQKAVNLRSEYDSFFREVARHFLPRHQDFWHEQTSRGRNRAGHLYDNAGIQARRKAVDLITSGVFPKGKEWVKLAISREVYEQISPDERQQVDIYLAQWSRVVQSFLNASNFRDVMKACAADWLTFGYCAVMPMSVAHTRKMGLGFWLAPANTIWLAQASDSAWNGAFWRRNMTPDDFKREFPNYPLNEQSISQTEEFPVVYGFLPGVGYNQEFAFLEREMGAFLYNRQIPVHERSVITATFGVAGGETYGLGLAGELLTESQMLNKTRKMHLEASSIWSNPMWMVDKSINEKDIVAGPGGRIPVASDLMRDGNLPVRPIPPSGDPNVSFANQSDMRQRIMEGMDLSPSAQQMQDQAVQTATYWYNAIAKEMKSSSELQDAFKERAAVPAVKQALVVLRKAMKIPADIKIDGTGIEVVIQSDAERVNSVARVEKLSQLLMATNGFPPEIIGSEVNLSELLRTIYAEMGESEMLLTAEQKAEAMAAMEEARQAQQQQAAAA